MVNPLFSAPSAPPPFNPPSSKRRGWLLCGGLCLSLVACGASQRDATDDASGQGGSAGQVVSGGASGKAGSAGASGTGGSSANGGSGGGPTCERPVTFSTVVVERPEPFDVVIVADHSGSLSWSRDSLSTGLQTLLASVHGQQARFFILTPTQYDITSEPAKTVGFVPLVTFRDPVTDEPYENAVTEYVDTCTDATGAIIDCSLRQEYQSKGLRLEGVWEFRMPEPIAAVTPDMDDAAIAAEQAKIADGILALGLEGAQEEQPLCTLNRYISQLETALPYNAVFVVISDEDDKSTPDECLASYSWIETNQGDGNTPCDANCELFRFSAVYLEPVASVEYTCVPVDDNGVRHPENSFWRSTTSSANPTCTPGTTAACDEQALDVAVTGCGDGHVAEDCLLDCSGGSGYTCFLERPADTADICTTSFVENGTTYENFPAYCTAIYGDTPFRDCTSQGYTVGGTPIYSGTETITKLVDVATLPEMVTAFRARADEVFGADSYFVETIQHDPSFDCTLGAGQDYGATLRTLASSAADVFPLCHDYAPALERVRGFAQTLVKSVFAVSLAEDEELGGVVVADRDGNERALLPSDYTYETKAGVLHVHPGVLTPADESLELSVLHECELR
jgi:hypothetical protein